MRRFVTLILCFCLFLTVIAEPMAFSELKVMAEENVNTILSQESNTGYETTSPQGTKPDIAFSGVTSGVNYISVFERYSTDYNIYSAPVSWDGWYKTSGASVCDAVYDQKDPAVAADVESGKYFTVWRNESENNAMLESVYGLLLEGEGGTPVTSAVNISDDVESVRSPDVAYGSTSKEYLVVWEGTVKGSLPAIYGRFVNASDGTCKGMTFKIAESAEDTQTQPRVIYDFVMGKYFVTWFESRNGESPKAVGRLLNSDGSFASGILGIGQSGDPQRLNSVQFDGAIAHSCIANKYLVTWIEVDSSQRFNVFGRFVNFDGTLMGDDSFLITGSVSLNEAKSHTQTAWDAENDTFIVVWQQNSMESQIYYSFINNDGDVGQPTALLDSRAIMVQSPAVAYNYNNRRFVVVYEASYPDSSQFLSIKKIEQPYVSPKYLTFDPDNPADMNSYLSIPTGTLDRVRNGSVFLTPDIDYTTLEGCIQFKKEYLATLERGQKYRFFLDISEGYDPYVEIKIGQPVVPVFATFNKNVLAQQDIKVCIPTADYITWIKNGNVQLNADDFSVYMNTLTIKKSYLSSLPFGKTTLFINMMYEYDILLEINVYDELPRNAMVRATTIVFDKGLTEHKDIPIEFWNMGNQFLGIPGLKENVEYSLGSYYTNKAVDGTAFRKYKLKSTIYLMYGYLSQLPTGSTQTLTLDFATGADPVINIRIIDSSVPDGTSPTVTAPSNAS